MIWIRRSFAALLGVLFVPLFLAALLVIRVDGTLLETGFYKDQLRKADLFTFLYNDVLPVAVDEQLSNGLVLPESLNLTETVVSARVQRVLPPEWIEEQVLRMVDEVGPYVMGETDRFTVTVPISDRADAALAAIQETIRDADFDAFLFQEVVPDAIEEQFGETVELPLDIVLTKEEAVAALRDVFPPSWLEEQVDAAVLEVGPYFTGEQRWPPLPRASLAPSGWVAAAPRCPHRPGGG